MNANLYYVALISALAVPDIAGGLSAEDGRATEKKYADWYDRWARPRLKESRGRENPFTGKECWNFRSAMLHQGRFKQPENPAKRIAFIEPGHPNYSLHYCVIHDGTFLIQIDQFIAEILRGAELWLETTQGTETFEKNYEKFARRHPDGLASVRGVPVIG